ncbi:GNAT family N-acetyltransferase [Lichenihabitans sp. Uapishka_5]|uniref:GNAT family N-acetyltransferase n=1 Tax=Lichenihabitans sp. Uapishka_5 TaxID=3037302 RepID=UPI0029E7F505|nr:GNAT family N-acetyltransferase [Lichenihabitans sp. Uapishka_5]MDX7949919.1 GNAT family N-acetyltransferase [Lichenihabitans sp. Uapishka_5]
MIHIAPFEDRHWPDLETLWVEAWTALLPSIDFAARIPWFRNHVADLQREGATALVAHHTGTPLGFMTINPDTRDLDQLVTARAAQRRGIGRLLIRAAKARSPAELSLTVAQMNQPAIRLYESEGFAVSGTGISLRSGLPTFRMVWQGLA